MVDVTVMVVFTSWVIVVSAAKVVVVRKSAMVL